MGVDGAELRAAGTGARRRVAERHRRRHRFGQIEDIGGLLLHFRHWLRIGFGIGRFGFVGGSAPAAPHALASGGRRRRHGAGRATGAGAARLRRLRRARRGFGGVVVGDDAANGGENFLHRRFLRFRRLRHPRILARFAPPNRPRIKPAGRAAAPIGSSQANHATPRQVWHFESRTQAKTCATASRRAANAPSELPAVRRAHADPGVAHLLIVHLRIVDRHVEPSRGIDSRPTAASSV